MSFASLHLSNELLRAIAELGWEEPTPIQGDAIPSALAGRDVLACAMTGSGKTAAFLLPLIDRLQLVERGTTRALILVPTRELAAQILEVCDALAKHTGITAAAIFGGVGMGPQEDALKRGVDILIATPGRLLDHFQNQGARLDGLAVLVLDEADRMLDMGFLPDIRRVLSHIPKPQQTMLFSATLPGPIVELARELLNDPARLNIDRKALPATGITQAVFPVAEDLKPYLVLELLRRGEISNAIIFTRTKHRANRLNEFLQKQGVASDRIHGNRSQAQRTDALLKFKDGQTPVLVATDIAARGIDVEELSHVINFDIPQVPEDYIHRVGRTARAEATGEAFTLVSPQDEGELRAIERAVSQPIERRYLAGFDYEATPGEPFEIPITERIAQIRARRAEERKRAKEKAERKAQRIAEEQARQGGRQQRPAQPQQPRPAGSAGPAMIGQSGSPGNGRPAGQGRRKKRRGDRDRQRPGAAPGFAPPIAVGAPRYDDDRQPTHNAHPNYVGVFTGSLATQEPEAVPAEDRRPFGRRGQKPADPLLVSRGKSGNR